MFSYKRNFEIYQNDFILYLFKTQNLKLHRLGFDFKYLIFLLILRILISFVAPVTFQKFNRFHIYIGFLSFFIDPFLFKFLSLSFYIDLFLSLSFFSFSHYLSISLSFSLSIYLSFSLSPPSLSLSLSLSLSI